MENIETNLKKANDNYKIIISIIISIFLIFTLLYSFFPNGFVSKLGYSLILTFLLLIVTTTLFRLYLNISVTAKPIFKKLYVIVSLSIIFLGLFGLSTYLGLFDSPPASNRLDLLVNYLATIIIIVVSYFVFMKNKQEFGKELDKINRNRIIVTTLFILFIISVIGLYIYNPQNIMTRFSGTTNLIVFLILILIGFAFLGTLKSYDYLLKYPSSTNNNAKFYDFLRYIYILFGFFISGLFIYGILYYLGVLNRDGVKLQSLVMNILLLSTMIGILYKLFNVGGFLQKHPIYSLIVNTFLYIPCLLVDVLGIISGSIKSSDTTKNDFIFLLISLILLTGYFIFYNYILPYIQKKYYNQGGITLVNNPINIQKLYSYQIPTSNMSITNSKDIDYNYALSFWFYIDSFPPSTKSSYLNSNNLLSIDKILMINYEPINNSLIVTTNNNDNKQNDIIEDNQINNIINNKLDVSFNDKMNDITNKIQNLNINYDFDNNGDRILYSQPNIELQKWNNVVINYNGGTLDIFYNGNLVKSNIEVVTYINNNEITIGNKNGISGSICNVLYFNEPLNYLTINRLYNLLKEESPPTIKENNNKLF
jgi:hypothetical protein